jgi:hypothetical protein
MSLEVGRGESLRPQRIRDRAKPLADLTYRLEPEATVDRFPEFTRVQDGHVHPLLVPPIDPGECRGRPVPSPAKCGHRPDSVQPDRAAADEGQRAGDRTVVDASDE